MNIKNRIVGAILFAFVGAFAGFLAGFFVLALTINKYDALPFIGAAAAALGAVIGLAIGGEPGSSSSVGMVSTTDLPDQRSVDRMSRAVFGRSVTDPLPPVDAFVPQNLQDDHWQ